MKRFLILDALRFLLALCVAIGHVGMIPLFGPVGQASPLLDALARLLRTAIYGPGAVIAFFVISGFCIHYPFAESGAGCPLGRFYARRYLRILAPVVGVVLLFKLLVPATRIFGEGSVLWHSALWSIVCEEIYYAIYPALNWLNRHFGWGRILVLPVVASLTLTILFRNRSDWDQMGIGMTTLVLFPVWLSGCLLAEQSRNLGGDPGMRGIWVWRAVAFAGMWGTLMLHSHAGWYQTVTGPWLGLLFYFWIRAELRHSQAGQPARLLVWGGRWSYSLYLVHPLIFIVMVKDAGVDPQTGIGPWAAMMAAILAASYIFYLLVERPSHHLARRIHLFPAAPRALEVPPPGDAMRQGT